MKPRVCICCGKPISEGGSTPLRNPNVCAHCLSLADGIEETRPGSDDHHELALAGRAKSLHPQADDKPLHWVAHPRGKHRRR